MRDADITAPLPNMQTRFVVAVDYGTTFSCVAYAAVTEAPNSNVAQITANRIQRDLVKTIAGWPNDAQLTVLNVQSREVPTDIWYDDPAATMNGNGPHVTMDDEIMVEADAHNEANDNLPPDIDDRQLEDEDSFKRPLPDKVCFGYKVQEQLEYANRLGDGRPSDEPIRRMKLMLHEDEVTQPIRDELRPILRDLKENGAIERLEDVIADSLTCILCHTLKELRNEPTFKEDTPVEFVLCVPPLWTAKACRQMQEAMSIAIQRTGLGATKKKTVDNLFIVSEPEAASEYQLAGEDTIWVRQTPHIRMIIG